MSIRWNKAHTLCGYDKLVRGQRLFSPFLYRNEAEAREAELKAAAAFLEQGRISIPRPQKLETISELYAGWIRWLANHRSLRHARDMQGLMARALAIRPDMAARAAASLSVEGAETWAEAWAADLVDRGKGRGEVNKWIRHSQTAFNKPWGKRRAIREYPFNPFAHLDRFSIDKRAKYVPTHAEVNALRLAAEGEYRLYLEILVETGARVSEARTMEWRDVGPDWVVLYTKKSRHGDRVPRRLSISKELAARFHSWRMSHTVTLYVFQQEEQAAPRVPTWEAKNQRKVCSLAGVEHFPPSCLRHYYASNLAEQGAPLTTIQARLGHSQATTTNSYLREIKSE